MNTLEILKKDYPNENLKMIDGYDDCVMGIEIPSMRIIYSVDKIVQKLSETMEENDAIDFYYTHINTIDLDEKTPIFCHEF